MASDWDALEKEYTVFKDYAREGKFKTRILSVEIRSTSTGSIAQDFKFEDTDEYALPKATHWLTFKEGKDGWRKIHNRNLMMVLGATKEQAQSAVDTCESKGNQEAIVEAYRKMYNKLAQKHAEVEIEVSFDGQYSNADFTDPSVRMNGNSKKAKQEIDPLAGAEEVTLDQPGLEIDDIPF